MWLAAPETGTVPSGQVVPPGSSPVTTEVGKANIGGVGILAPTGLTAEPGEVPGRSAASFQPHPKKLQKPIGNRRAAHQTRRTHAGPRPNPPGVNSRTRRRPGEKHSSAATRKRSDAPNLRCRSDTPPRPVRWVIRAERVCSDLDDQPTPRADVKQRSHTVRMEGVAPRQPHRAHRAGWAHRPAPKPLAQGVHRHTDQGSRSVVPVVVHDLTQQPDGIRRPRPKHQADGHPITRNATGMPHAHRIKRPSPARERETPTPAGPASLRARARIGSA